MNEQLKCPCCGHQFPAGDTIQFLMERSEDQRKHGVQLMKENERLKKEISEFQRVGLDAAIQLAKMANLLLDKELSNCREVK